MINASTCGILWVFYCPELNPVCMLIQEGKKKKKNLIFQHHIFQSLQGQLMKGNGGIQQVMKKQKTSKLSVSTQRNI